MFENREPTLEPRLFIKAPAEFEKKGRFLLLFSFALLFSFLFPNFRLDELFELFELWLVGEGGKALSKFALSSTKLPCLAGTLCLFQAFAGGFLAPPRLDARRYWRGTRKVWFKLLGLDFPRLRSVFGLPPRTLIEARYQGLSHGATKGSVPVAG